jgi:tungstate transport system permease protein
VQTGNAFIDAFRLLASGDGELWQIVLLSLQVTTAAVLIAAAIGLPIGALLAIKRFRGRGVLTVVLNALMGLPPVVVGLIIYLCLSKSGPLGALSLLYTPTAMIIAQAVLVLPIVAALGRQVIAEINTEYRDQLSLMGFSTLDTIKTLLWEARHSLMVVVLAGFGRAIAEVGAVMLVGGNIAHVTRTMTTTIALETSRGNLALALGLGLVLILIAIAINVAVASVKRASDRAAYV